MNVYARRLALDQNFTELVNVFVWKKHTLSHAYTQAIWMSSWSSSLESAIKQNKNTGKNLSSEIIIADKKSHYFLREEKQANFSFNDLKVALKTSTSDVGQFF